MTDYLAEHSIEVLDTLGGRHLKIRRRDRQDVRLTWDDLQAIKNEYLGEEVCAVEVFPPASELVDELPIRHLWEVPAESVPSLLYRYRHLERRS